MPMKPIAMEDPATRASARGAQPAGSATAGPPGAMAAENPLRGLASAEDTEGGATAPAARTSLWSRIKRAFQYGSQGGAQG
jgi:hypothetical protein